MEIKVNRNLKKRDLIREYFRLTEEYGQPLTDRLFNLADQKKVTDGTLLTKPYYQSFAYKRIGEIIQKSHHTIRKTRKRELIRLLEDYAEDLQKLKDFVEEQEAADMESCQRTQVLKEKGEL